MSIVSEGGCEEQKEADTETCLCWGQHKTTACRTKPVTALTPSVHAFVLNHLSVFPV